MIRGIIGCLADHPRRARLLTLCVYCCTVLTLPFRGANVTLFEHTAACRTGAVTAGCVTATCCTEKCYLDRNGVHHCVPADGASCECGFSSSDQMLSSMYVCDVGTLDEVDALTPDLPRTWRALDFPPLMLGFTPGIPTPPPW
jgi:hypothetical protein